MYDDCSMKEYFLLLPGFIILAIIGGILFYFTKSYWCFVLIMPLGFWCFVTSVVLFGMLVVFILITIHELGKLIFYKICLFFKRGKNN